MKVEALGQERIKQPSEMDEIKLCKRVSSVEKWNYVYISSVTLFDVNSLQLFC
jgi:hypothetical protein